MSFVQREIDRIRLALVTQHPDGERLYAAQQALEWALEPSGIRVPYSMITGIPEGSAACSAAPHPPQS